MEDEELDTFVPLMFFSAASTVTSRGTRETYFFVIGWNGKIMFKSLWKKAHMHFQGSIEWNTNLSQSCVECLIHF